MEAAEALELGRFKFLVVLLLLREEELFVVGLREVIGR